MDLFDVIRSCFRRWYVLLPLVLLTAWYGHQVYSSVTPVYYSQAVIGLAPPSYRVDQAVAGQPVPRNGLLDIGGAPLLANMAALGLKQPAVVDRVLADGGMPDFSARLFPVPETAPPIPLVMLEQTAPDPGSAIKTLELVTAEMDATLESIQQQARVPEDMMVESFVVSPPSTPIAAMPSRTRSTTMVFGAGIGLSVLVTVLLDTLLMRRRQRTASPPPADREAEPVSSGRITGGTASPNGASPAAADLGSGNAR